MLKKDRIMVDPTSSSWLTEALKSALRRDPVDAALDAEALAEALDEWLDTKLGLADARIENER
jgi:ABC-type uncharacterized transport system YnjBCD ATPase subunit